MRALWRQDDRVAGVVGDLECYRARWDDNGKLFVLIERESFLVSASCSRDQRSSQRYSH